MVNFFIFFLFQTLRFFRKIGQSFLCFSDFPKFTKPEKTFKNTSNLPNFQLPCLDSSFTTHSTQYIHIYIYSFQSSKHSKLFQFHAFFFFKDWARVGLKPTAYVPRPLRIEAHVVPFQLSTYTYIHNKIFNIYSMQNYIYNEITGVVSLMARLTAPGDALPAHLSLVLKMFLKHTEKNELKEPSECTFSLK